MEFCEKCGGLLVPQKKGSKTIFICRKCGRKQTPHDKKAFKLSITSETKPGKIVIVDKKSIVETLPKTNAPCPKCDNSTAYWWMRQTRAADEASTRFYKCTKCGHVWREYE